MKTQMGRQKTFRGKVGSKKNCMKKTGKTKIFATNFVWEQLNKLHLTGINNIYEQKTSCHRNELYMLIIVFFGMKFCAIFHVLNKNRQMSEELLLNDRRGNLIQGL